MYLHFPASPIPGPAFPVTPLIVCMTGGWSAVLQMILYLVTLAVRGLVEYRTQLRVCEGNPVGIPALDGGDERNSEEVVAVKNVENEDVVKMASVLLYRSTTVAYFRTVPGQQ